MLKKSDYIYNTRTGKRVRVQRLVRMHSDNMEVRVRGTIHTDCLLSCFHQTFQLFLNDVICQSSAFVVNSYLPLALNRALQETGMISSVLLPLKWKNLCPRNIIKWL